MKIIKMLFVNLSNAQDKNLKDLDSAVFLNITEEYTDDLSRYLSEISRLFGRLNSKQALFPLKSAERMGRIFP